MDFYGYVLAETIVLFNVLFGGACVSKTGELHEEVQFRVFVSKRGDEGCAKFVPGGGLVLFTPGFKSCRGV